jgi:NAD/NADP transhydrogenase alpha subunit
LNSQLARIALAGFGALVVVGVMAFLGFMVYALVLRPRYQADVKRTTASMRAVRVDQTGEMRRTGEIRPPNQDETP